RRSRGTHPAALRADDEREGRLARPGVHALRVAARPRAGQPLLRRRPGRALAHRPSARPSRHDRALGPRGGALPDQGREALAEQHQPAAADGLPRDDRPQDGRHRRGGPLPDRRGEARGADDRGGVAQFAESTAAGALAARACLQSRPIVGWAVRSGAVGRAWARTLLTAHCSLRTAHYASAASYACSAISSRTALSSRSVPGWSASRWPRTASNRSSSFAACTVLPQSQSITRTVSPYRVGSGPTGGVVPDCQQLARPLRQLRHSEALELGSGPLQRVGGLRDVAV